MNDPILLAFILRLMNLASKYDSHGDLWWRTDETYAPVTFFVNCNDVFWWACADCEKVTEENVAVLESSYADCAAACSLGELYAPALFCARVRSMRPQGPLYPTMDKALWPLFDACGPERADSPRPT